MAILYGNGGTVFRGTKQVARVSTWSIDQSGASPTDWSGGLTAVWEARPELGSATLELRDIDGRIWAGKVTITDVPFRIPPDRAAEIGFQGDGALERR